MKSKATVLISLPENIINKLDELNLSKTNYSHSLKFISLLMRDSYRENGNIFCFSPKPKVYLEKVFSSKYNIWLNTLIENNIIERDFYRQGKCYHYRINLNLFLFLNHIDSICMEKCYNKLITKTIKSITKDENQDTKQYEKWFKDDIKSLTIDYDKLTKLCFKLVNEIKISDFKINDEIPKGVYQYILDGKKYKKHASLREIKSIAKQNGLSVILRKKTCIIADLDEFIEQKKISTLIYNHHSIINLSSGNIYAKRSKTNNRLNTNLTNLFSPIVNEICIQNELVQIDISNSQFAFLTAITSSQMNSDEFRAFKRFSILGTLYESITEMLCLESREMAKQALFEILFSSRKNNSQEKKKLKEFFPEIIKWIDEYKKEFGDNNFSIMLQQKEAELMIDGLLKNLKSKGFFCITKHDSIIIRKHDYLNVLKLMTDFFLENGLECQLKTSWCNNATSDHEYFLIHRVIKEESKHLVFNVPFHSNHQILKSIA